MTSAPRSPSALVVGAGLMGRWHAETVRRLGVAVAGVVDPDAGAAAELAQRVGGCPTWSSLDEALSAGAPTAAHVCSPTATHGVVVGRLLEAGCHVLVEKPLAEDAGATAELLEAATRAGRMLCPVHQFVFQDGALAVARALAGAGPVRAVDVVVVSAGAAGRGPETAEAVMADILPHPLALVRRLLGPPSAAARWRVADSPPGELRALTSVGGATVGMLVSMAGRPTRNTLRVVCEGGTFHADLFHGFAVREAPEVGRSRKVFRPFGHAGRTLLGAGANLARRALRREPAYPGLRELCRRFYASAGPGGSSPITPDETLDVARARDAILEARRGAASA